MDFDDEGLFCTGNTLHIDADSVVFAQCCVFTEDSDYDKQRIARGIRRRVQELTLLAGCDSYVLFLTTKTNFRDMLVDDYKANRSELERPVNLSWAKRWTATNLECVYQDQLEADDLLGIYMRPDVIIWSIDKDLRQIPGRHLDDATRQVVTITETGTLKDLGKKVYFDGLAGFYFQCLTGDSTDHILGCGVRESAVYKSGEKKGIEYVKRKGVGPKAAIKIIVEACMCPGDSKTNMLWAVIDQYKLIHGADWQSHLETQANLLFMVRVKHDKVIRRWTFDDREEYFDLAQGVVLNDYTPTTAKD